MYEDEQPELPTPDMEMNWNEANDYWNEDDDQEPDGCIACGGDPDDCDCGGEGSDPLDDQEYDGQPDFMFEHDSSMASAGFGTDEDYGYYGEQEYE